MLEKGTETGGDTEDTGTEIEILTNDFDELRGCDIDLCHMFQRKSKVVQLRRLHNSIEPMHDDKDQR